MLPVYRIRERAVSRSWWTRSVDTKDCWICIWRQHWPCSSHRRWLPCEPILLIFVFLLSFCVNWNFSFLAVLTKSWLSVQFMSALLSLNNNRLINRMFLALLTLQLLLWNKLYIVALHTPNNLHDNPIPDTHPIVPFPFSSLRRFLAESDGRSDLSRSIVDDWLTRKKEKSANELSASS